MLSTNNPLEELAASRLLELCGPNAPWNRSLWGIGIELSLQELIEACDAMRSGILSEASVKRLIKSILRTAGKDPALSNAQKSLLNANLKETPRPGGAAYFTIRQITQQIGKGYLSHWASVIGGGTRFSPERLARSVASHLLDRGFSSAFLYSWLKARLYEGDQSMNLAEVFEELELFITSTPVHEFGVLVAFEHPPQLSSGFPVGWLTAAAIAQWLKEQGHTTSGIRPAGGILLGVEARDPYGAGDAARGLLDRYNSRASIGTGNGLSPLPFLWVTDFPDPLPLKKGSRGVRVEALNREGLVFAHTLDAPNENVAAAIELLAHLEDSSPAAAVAGGWAAIEGLLGEPGNRSIAADHLASLVACSVARAELTALSYKVQRQCPRLSSELASCLTNRDRSALLAKWIVGEAELTLRHLTDQAALQRIAHLLSEPTKQLSAMREVIGDAFHRLYRQRNLVLHGGQISSVALAGSLRTVAQLAGAGMDRIAHGLYVNGLQPMELVARAGVAISTIDSSMPEQCVDLLEA